MRKGSGWLRGTVATASVAAASGMLVTMAASRRWRAATDPEPVSFGSLTTLPAPVQRYFRLVLRDGQPRIRIARVRQSGTFRRREGPDPGPTGLRSSPPSASAPARPASCGTPASGWLPW